MLFAHDTEVALQAATALVNTVSGDTEQLTDVRALARFTEQQRWTGLIEHSEAELAAVRELRPRLRRIWYADEDEVVDIVNALLRQANALPQLVKHDDWDYHLHATAPDAPLATRMAVEAAMGVADVVRAKQLDRLRTCAYPTCEYVVVDLTKNRSKQYCDHGCGNRAAVAAYRARQATRRSTDSPGR